MGEKQHLGKIQGQAQTFGCGSKPMVVFWGRFATHFSLFWWGLGYGLLTHGHLGVAQNQPGGVKQLLVQFWYRFFSHSHLVGHLLTVGMPSDMASRTEHLHEIVGRFQTCIDDPDSPDSPLKSSRWVCVKLRALPPRQNGKAVKWVFRLVFLQSLRVLFVAPSNTSPPDEILGT